MPPRRKRSRRLGELHLATHHRVAERRLPHLRGPRHRRRRQHRRDPGLAHLHRRHHSADHGDHGRPARPHQRHDPDVRLRLALRRRSELRVPPRRQRSRRLGELHLAAHHRVAERRLPHLRGPRHRRGRQHRRDPGAGHLHRRHRRPDHDHHRRATLARQRPDAVLHLRLQRGRRLVRVQRRRGPVHELLLTARARLAPRRSALLRRPRGRSGRQHRRDAGAPHVRHRPDPARHPHHLGAGGDAARHHRHVRLLRDRAGLHLPVPPRRRRLRDLRRHDRDLRRARRGRPPLRGPGRRLRR